MPFIQNSLGILYDINSVHVPRGRIELPTQGFSVLCSTTELPRPQLLAYYLSNFQSFSAVADTSAFGLLLIKFQFFSAAADTSALVGPTGFEPVTKRL